MDDYKIIVEQENQTVMAHYDVKPKPAEGYQSEAALEASLIKQLQGQGYEYAHIKDEAGLLRNLLHPRHLRGLYTEFGSAAKRARKAI